MKSTVLVALVIFGSVVPAIASGPSAPPRKSPVANVGHGPKRGNIPNVGHGPKPGNIPTPSPVADTGPAPVKGNVAIPGAIPRISRKDEGCKHHFIVGSDTLFAFDKYDLSPQVEETLNQLGPMIRDMGSHPVVVEGHTDSIGTDEYNQALSEHRANTVMQWLQAHKFIPGHATTIGFGKRKPIAPNTKPDGTDNPDGRQLNRRVELVVDTCEK